ncbi:MAG: thiamine pyrophosphate-binding protein [Nitriliruptoraceae bacterium]
MATSPPDTVEITGGEAIARMLLACDAGPMFGMGGFQLLPFYDAARRLGLAHHLINDERAGVFAADAYAKVSGGVGLVDATLGPGATNLVTGLVEALNAGTALIAVIGDTHRQHSWKNMTQESRQLDILRPACKEVLRVEMVERIPELIRRAFVVATSGRPGPVIVDVPEDIAHAKASFAIDAFFAPVRSRGVPAIRSRPDAAQTAAAAELLASSKRPVLLAGGGVHLSDASAAVTAFARSCNIPVAHTLTGKGSLPCTDPLNAGLFGRYDRIANALIDEADVLFVVGCKLGEIATKRYVLPDVATPVIHLDVLAEEFDRIVHPQVALWGDVRLGIEDLASTLGAAVDTLGRRLAPYACEVAERMEKWRTGVAQRLTSDEVPIGMPRLLTEINAVLPADGILVADGGFAAHWGGLLFDTKQAGRGFVPDRGFASIGYGVPGAIGAALAAPGRTVFSLTGDGGMNMSLGELETARRLSVTCAIIVVNNAASGYVKALQYAMYGEGASHASDLTELNYAAIATAMGCHGIRVEDPAALADALVEAMHTPGPSVVDVVVTRDPAQMLPAVDNRAVAVRDGDRIA